MRLPAVTVGLRSLPIALLAFTAIPAGAAPPDAAPRGALRVAVSMRAGPHSHVSPLTYWGGFQSKTAVYEPLVRWGRDGRLAPCLAASWRVSPDGRTYDLRLREGVVAHDGKPLDAAAVRDHLLRWRGNPGNRWLGSTDRMERVEATGPLDVRVTLSEPWCFLEEATIVNPAHVVAAGAYDHEGTFRKNVGTGPYAVEAFEPDRVLSLVPHDGWWRGRPGLSRLDLVSIPSAWRESPRLLEWVRSGGVDAVADGEGPIVPREGLAEAARDPALRVISGPGAGVTYLRFNLARAPFSDRDARRRVAAAIDRARLVAEGELGWADPTTTLVRGGWAGWPSEGGVAVPVAPGAARASATIVATPGRMARHARALVPMCSAAGVDLRVEELESTAMRERTASGDFDLAFGGTHGEPYDPYVMLQILFLPRAARTTAASSAALYEDPAVVAAVRAACSSRDDAVRARAFATVQRRLDEEVPLVPLFVSKRVAVAVRGVEGLSIGSDGFDLGLGSAASDLPARPVVFPADGAPAAATAAGAAAPVPAPAAGPTDPRDGEVLLPAENGWRASLVLDNGKTGVWTVRSFKVFDRLGCPEIVGLDDRGRLFVLTSYSGRWTPIQTIEDGKWLGGVDVADVDPDVPGAEIYTGGEKGNLYEVVAHPSGVLDNRLAASLPGQAINIVLAGELDPSNEGGEVLAFTWPDGLHCLAPDGKGRLEVRWRDPTVERVREAIVLPTAPGAPVEVATASRNGHLAILTLSKAGRSWRIVHAEAMGMGRVAMRPSAPGEPLVLYTVLDDGRVLRHARAADGAYATETVYLGPQGARGIAAGRFDADPAAETIAVFGYSGRVEVLARRGDRWTVETVFRDRDKGHWLSAGEYDGRNATQEIVASGYGGRIVLLSRPVGYGRTELRDPEAR